MARAARTLQQFPHLHRCIPAHYRRTVNILFLHIIVYFFQLKPRERLWKGLYFRRWRKYQAGVRTGHVYSVDQATIEAIAWRRVYVESHLLEAKWRKKDYQLFSYQQPVGMLPSYLPPFWWWFICLLSILSMLHELCGVHGCMWCSVCGWKRVW